MLTCDALYALRVFNSLVQPWRNSTYSEPLSLPGIARSREGQKGWSNWTGASTLSSSAFERCHKTLGDYKKPDVVSWWKFIQIGVRHDTDRMTWNRPMWLLFFQGGQTSTPEQEMGQERCCWPLSTLMLNRYPARAYCMPLASLTVFLFAWIYHLQSRERGSEE